MGRMTGFFGSVVVVYGLLVGSLFWFQRSLLYVPPGDRPDLAAAAISGLEAVAIETEDGLELTHWYRPPANPGAPVVILFHGNAGHIGDRAAKYRPLFEAGFGVFLAEYRGYGGNPGSPTEEDLTADARSVLAFLAARGVTPARTIVYGESLGTGLAVKMAADRPVAGLVLEAPPGSIAEVAQAHYWYVPAKWMIWDKWNVIDLLERGQRAIAGASRRIGPDSAGTLRPPGLRGGDRREGGAIRAGRRPCGPLRLPRRDAARHRFHRRPGAGRSSARGRRRLIPEGLLDNRGRVSVFSL